MAEKKEKRYVSDNAQLMAEWDWEKNAEFGFDPSYITQQSNKKVWWKCSQGHEWQAKVNNRFNGCGCPYCSGRKVLLGYNDLLTVNPYISTEWNYTKNDILRPEHFTANSGKKVWWICKKGHEWQAVICERNKGTGCPICKSERNTSFPEYAILYYLSKNGIDAIHTYKYNGYELDIFIPCKNIAIEYDGYYWHKNKVSKDLEKNRKCAADGIKLYRIREGLSSLEDSSVDYIIQKNQSDLQHVLEIILFEISGMQIKINIAQDAIEIESLREHSEKENSVLALAPEIAIEWNYEKNGMLRPEHSTANNGKKVWWKCKEGHEWKATIDNRRKGKKCPYCTGRYAVRGQNDLLTINPDLAKEWDYDKNIGLTPSDVTPNSEKKAWWRCVHGHTWQSTISNRSNGRGCPYCSGRYCVSGVNDLQTLNPSLADEWNYEKNIGLPPTDVMPNSNKKVWWVCDNGHEWQATISSRNNGRGCPYCAGQRLLRGQNDLQTMNPTLATEWNYDKNIRLTPADVMPNSNKKAWWKCNCGHEWEAIISNRNKGSGCPECAKRKRKKKDT